MKKHLSLLMLVAALLVPWASNAQSLGDYTFSTGTDATKWISMTGATQILTPSGSDGLASAVRNIGFSFPFGEENYTKYSVNTDGNLRLGPTVTGTTNYTTPFSSSLAITNNPKINAFGCDGYGVSGSHYVKELKTVDDNGDTLLVVEFCMGTYNTTTRDNLYKWQIHLYQNGNVEIVFPSASGIPATAPNVAHQCGMCVDATDGWIITSANDTAEHFTAGSSVTNATGTWFSANRYYLFERPVITCHRPRNIIVDNLSHDAARIAWQDPSGNAVSYQFYYSTTPNINIDSVAYETVNDTAVFLSNLTPMTTYYYVIVADCGSGDYSMPTTEKKFTTKRDCGYGYANIDEAVSMGTSASSTYTAYGSTTYPIGHSANIFTVEEMVNLGLEAAGSINAIKLHAGATASNIPLRVYIGKTGLSEFSAAGDTTGFTSMTLVYDDTLHTTAQEWVTIPFDTPFPYGLDSNLVIYLYRYALPTAAGTFYYTTTTPAYRSFYGYRSSTSTANPTFTKTYLRTDVAFDICYEIPSCVRPSDIALVDTTENSLGLTWTGCDNANYYLVTYGPSRHNALRIDSRHYI